MQTATKTVRVGAAQGFYGDTIGPAVETAKHGSISYLCFDCLAELTMAILQKDRQKDPSMGYTRDITPSMQALLPIAREKGIKILTNAGGINPRGRPEGGHAGRRRTGPEGPQGRLRDRRRRPRPARRVA